MKNFLQIASGVSTGQLLLELHQQPELWNRNPARLYPGSPHENSDDIWLRYNDETAYRERGSYQGFNDEHDPVWYPAFYALPSVRQLVYDLARKVEAERIGGIFIWRVRPGQEIRTHVDTGWHVDYYDKYNVTLQSAPGCRFEYPDDSESIQDRPGDVHRFNNRVPHRVVNESPVDYIVMVVCLRTHSYDRCQGRAPVKPLPPVATPDTVHHFTPELYAKELRVPAGYELGKHTHDFTHLSILAKGHIALTVDGAVRELDADRDGPQTLEVTANSIHSLMAITDTVWYCIHAVEGATAETVDEVLINKTVAAPAAEGA